MNSNIYAYLDYVDFLENHLKTLPNMGRGVRKKMAEALNCQMAFITHVFNREKHFSSEHIFKLAELFEFNSDEIEFLITLHSYNRAGTVELKSFYKKTLDHKREQYKLLKNRLSETQSLSIEVQSEYYSHWLYGAVHMASTVPQLQTREALRDYFKITNKELSPIVDFLSKAGLVSSESGKILPGKANIYIGKESPLVNQHHSIWRLKALNDLKKDREDDIHYSLCFSVSQEDWSALREKIINSINEYLQIIRPSKEEKLGLICIDFQEV